MEILSPLYSFEFALDFSFLNHFLLLSDCQKAQLIYATAACLRARRFWVDQQMEHILISLHELPSAYRLSQLKDQPGQYPRRLFCHASVAAGKRVMISVACCAVDFAS
jgi:hypothetical protein